MAAVLDDNVLRITRVFDAPRERVFDAWTDGKQFGQWFGPHDVTTVYCEIDARTGGSWRLLGRNAQRTFAVSGKYLEVKRPERLVFTFAWHDKGDHGQPREHETTVRIELRALGDRTEMTMTQGAFLDGTAVANHNRGWSQSFEKLATLLGRTA